MLTPTGEVAGVVDLRPLFAPRSITVVGASPRSWIAETVREQREWDTIVRRDGLKAALAWRARRYDERLAGSGRASADELGGQSGGGAD